MAKDYQTHPAMPTTDILCLGISARWLAEQVAALGLNAQAADWFADVDTQLALPTHRLENWNDVLPLVRHLRPRAVLWGSGFETHLALAEQLALETRLLNIALPAARAVRDPFQLQSIAGQVGWLMPEMKRELNLEETGWLLKSGSRAGGTHIQRWPTPTPPDASDTYFQREVSGVSCSATFLAHQGACELIGSFHQLSGDLTFGTRSEFQFVGAVGPLPIAKKERTALLALGHHLTQRLPLQGCFGVDYQRDSQGNCWLLEVNPRLTASMELIERSGAPALLPRHLAAFGIFLPPAKSPSWPRTEPGIAGKAILFWDGEQSLPVTEQLAADMQAAQRAGTLADIPTPGSTILPGAPVVTLFSRGRDSAETLCQLRDSADIWRRRCRA